MKKQIIMFVMLALVVGAGNAFAYEDVTPSGANAMVKNEGAFILDVRTPQEWNGVGHPGPNNLGEGAYLENHVLNIAYATYRKGFADRDVLEDNPRFVAEVEKILDKDAVIIIICRSGNRSIKAAHILEKAGFTHVYNIPTGFEGAKDANGHRTVNGWKVDGLPYNYSEVGAYKD